PKLKRADAVEPKVVPAPTQRKFFTIAFLKGRAKFLGAGKDAIDRCIEKSELVELIHRLWLTAPVPAPVKSSPKRKREDKAEPKVVPPSKQKFVNVAVLKGRAKSLGAGKDEIDRCIEKHELVELVSALAASAKSSDKKKAKLPTAA
ncbi:unnamed protein product, partial [Polarella glacialis]